MGAAASSRGDALIAQHGDKKAGQKLAKYEEDISIDGEAARRSSNNVFQVEEMNNHDLHCHEEIAHNEQGADVDCQRSSPEAPETDFSAQEDGNSILVEEFQTKVNETDDVQHYTMCRPQPVQTAGKILQQEPPLSPSLVIEQYRKEIVPNVGSLTSTIKIQEQTPPKRDIKTKLTDPHECSNVLFSLIPVYQTGEVELDELIEDAMRHADPHVRDSEENTLLIKAVEFSKLALVRGFLRRGCQVNAKNCYGFAPLHFACYRTSVSVKVAQRLLEAGADPDILDNHQVTPLHYAAAEGNVALVALLLFYKAKVNAKDDSKNTALDYAAQNGSEQCVTLLQSKMPANSLWKITIDPSSNCCFYVNQETGESSWTRPTSGRSMEKLNTTEARDQQENPSFRDKEGVPISPVLIEGDLEIFSDVESPESKLGSSSSQANVSCLTRDALPSESNISYQELTVLTEIANHSGSLKISDENTNEQQPLAERKQGQSDQSSGAEIRSPHKNVFDTLVTVNLEDGELQDFDLSSENVLNASASLPLENPHPDGGVKCIERINSAIVYEKCKLGEDDLEEVDLDCVSQLSPNQTSQGGSEGPVINFFCRIHIAPKHTRQQGLQARATVFRNSSGHLSVTRGQREDTYDCFDFVFDGPAFHEAPISNTSPFQDHMHAFETGQSVSIICLGPPNSGKSQTSFNLFRAFVETIMCTSPDKGEVEMCFRMYDGSEIRELCPWVHCSGVSDAEDNWEAALKKVKSSTAMSILDNKLMPHFVARLRVPNGAALEIIDLAPLQRASVSFGYTSESRDRRAKLLDGIIQLIEKQIECIVQSHPLQPALAEMRPTSTQQELLDIIFSSDRVAAIFHVDAADTSLYETEKIAKYINSMRRKVSHR